MDFHLVSDTFTKIARVESFDEYLIERLASGRFLCSTHDALRV